MLLRNLFMDLISENMEIWTDEFKTDLVETMKQAITLEKEFINDCLPVSQVGLNAEEFCQYIDSLLTAALRVWVLIRSTPAFPILSLGSPRPWISRRKPTSLSSASLSIRKHPLFLPLTTTNSNPFRPAGLG